MFDLGNRFSIFLLTLVLAGAACPASPEAAWTTTWASAPVEAGAAIRVEVRARNSGRRVWERAGREGVRLTLLVVDGNGNPWNEQPAPAPAPYATPPGGSTTFAAALKAPGIPGRYTVLVGLERAGGAALDVAPTRIPLEVAAKTRSARTVAGPGASGR